MEARDGVWNQIDFQLIASFAKPVYIHSIIGKHAASLCGSTSATNWQTSTNIIVNNNTTYFTKIKLEHFEVSV